VSGAKMEREQVLEFKNGKMVLSTLVNGKMIKLMVMGN
jgi:hypothetical protein